MSNLDNENDKKNTQPDYEHTARLRTITMDDDKTSPKKRFLEKKIRNRTKKMSDSYRKRYIILGVIVFTFFVIAYQFVKVRSINFEALNNKLYNVAVKSDDDQQYFNSEQLLSRNLGIESDEIESFIYVAPKSNMDANEILIIKCKPQYVNSVMAKIQKRIDSQLDSFRSYAKDQYDIMKNCEFRQNGDYIYFISSNDKDTIDKMIDNSYN